MRRYCKVDVEIVPQKEMSLVDQWLNQDFNYNEFGTLRNDISSLAAATTQQEYERIAQRLMVLDTKDNFVNLSDDDKLKIIPSRYTQDPAELERFTEYLCSAHPDLMGVVEKQTEQTEQQQETQQETSDNEG